MINVQKSFAVGVVVALMAVLCLSVIAGASETITISAIEIQGNEYISDEEILTVINTRVGATVTVSDIEEDLARIDNLGYFENVYATPVQHGKGVKLNFVVVENEIVNDIVIKGNEVIPTEELESLITMKTGTVFNSRDFSTDIDKILQYYIDKGYHADLISLDYDETTKELIVEFAELKIGSVSIAGNEKTQDYVLWREIETQKGDYFNAHRVTEDLRRMYNLGVFEDVIPEFEEKEDYTVDITYVVKELKTGSAIFGAGYSTVDGLIGQIGVSDKNFLGRGYNASLDLEFGSKKHSYELGFFDPWFAGTRLGFGIDLYDTTVERGEGDSKYDIWRRGGEVSLSRYLDVYTRLSGRLRVEDSAIRPIGQSVDDDETSLRSLKFTINRDLRDSFINPTSGYVASAMIENAGGFLGGDSNFTKYQVNANYYDNIWRDHIMAFRGTLGLIQTTDDSVVTQEKFNVGGPNSIRGYDYGEFQGTKQIVINSEYRVPLSDNFQGVGFVDIGRAWEDDDEISISDMKIGAGVGLRVALPIGLILRVDVGWGDSGAKSYFSLGHSF